jgi:protein-L-isoaspartate O-methyltransferase
MNWEPYARELADQVSYPQSRWHAALARVPRHVFVPRWWEWPECTLTDGSADEQHWMRTAYSDQTLVTAIGGLHADHAKASDRPTGLPTSSSTLPSLVVRMYRHAQIYDGATVLDVATGSGYGTALLCGLLGDRHVTSIDVDPYLTATATTRLADIGLRPDVVTCDANGELPGVYDRIVSMVSMPTVPPSWLDALKPGGRLVTVIARTALIITANKAQDADGAVYAQGRVERDWAMFMPTRSGVTYPPRPDDLFVTARNDDGETIGPGRFPVLRVADSWELASLLEVTVPGIEHDYIEDDDGRRTSLMVHRDGSWARATAIGDETPTVHQAGPRRLWDILDDLRADWLRNGQFQLFGAQAFITPSGKIHLVRGDWKATITA